LYSFSRNDQKITAITAIYPRNSGAIAAHFLDQAGPFQVIIFGKTTSVTNLSVFWVVIFGGHSLF